MLMEKVKGAVEERYENPLRAKIGSAVTLEETDLKDLNFFVKEIRAYRRKIGSQSFVFVDYVLLARPLGKADVWVRLRLVPLEGADADRIAGLTHHALFLRLDDEFAYEESFHKVLTDTTKKFEVLEGGKVVEEYWRINDVQDSYRAEVSVIRDTDSDGRVTSDEVEMVSLDYWDYWREVKGEAGQPVRQYLFVEMDRKNGWFQLWRGQETDSQKVFVY
jgi:hypothetical protein